MNEENKDEKELKDEQKLSLIAEQMVIDDIEKFKRKKQEIINWIKKIRLAEEWRAYQLRCSDNVMFRIKTPKPKEFMDNKEIDYYMKFGSLHLDTCKLIKLIFNISDEDLK